MPTSGPQRPLSEREKQLIELASNGFTDAAIAHRLGISEATVATYWGRIRMKYGPYPRPELIANAVRGKYEEEIASLKQENQTLVRNLRQSIGVGSDGAPDDFFRQVLESAADAILVVDKSGIIDWVNSAAAELFGYTRSEITGQHQSLLIPERFRQIHRQHIKDYFESPAKRTMSEHSTTYALTKSGEEFAVAATLSPVTTGDQTLAVCAVRPLSSIAASVLRGRAKLR